jgi:hypothetical protein
MWMPRGANVAETLAPAAINIGFLTVLQEPTGQVGGYLVTNGWGRPLEFRLSTAVQPNRVQQILFGNTLQAYICADLIGKTLVDKTATSVQLLITDREAVLELRLRIEIPMLWLAPQEDPQAADLAQQGAEIARPSDDRGPLLCHPRFLQDKPALHGMVERLADILDLAEPFGRIREAIGEARKIGATNRN